MGWRLAMATSRSSRTTWRSGRFWRRASSSRHSASRRAISRLRRLSWCRPGSRRQRSSSARCAIDSMKVGELGLGPGRSTELRQAVGEMIGQIEQVADVVERVMELGRAERPMPPVGARLAAGQADPQHLPDQVHQRQRVTETDQARGDLDVEHPAGKRPGPQQADPQIFTRRMHHDLDRRVEDHVPERDSGRGPPAGRSPPAARESPPGSGRAPARTCLH